MNIVLLQSKVSEKELAKLFREFPQILFLQLTDSAFKTLSQEDWARIEVLYGNKLTPEQLAQAHQLKWIHCPTQNLNPLCLQALEEQGNILLTIAEEENAAQAAEFILSAVLAFTKNLFHWHEAKNVPDMVWDSKWRDSMATLAGKRMVQVGLGTVGIEIARVFNLMGVEVWGVSEKETFHPFCKKVFTFKNLAKALETGDIISIALPRSSQRSGLIRREELKMMKDGAILSILGFKSTIDEKALAAAAAKGKFRGIVLDAYYQIPISSSSVLWDLPNILITPEVGPRPKGEGAESIRAFRYNMRQYLHGNFADMRNLVTAHSAV